METWPPRKTTISSDGDSDEHSGPGHDCTRIDYRADVIILLDSSTNFEYAELVQLRETLGTLIDETFDLSPDVVRISFITYSDRVGVPVALGNYQDKVELLTKIGASTPLDGEPILLMGLEAAKEQFDKHGRANVTRVILTVTTGESRLVLTIIYR
jgi:hypothetical protein